MAWMACAVMARVEAEQPLFSENQVDGASTTGDSTRDRKLPRSAALLREAAEYVVLDYLSLYLSSYFNDTSFDNKFLRDYTRADVPQILLENRVLLLLSTPPGERAGFLNEATESPGGWKVIRMYKNGMEYVHFHLMLPEGTSISRPNADKLIIDSKRISF
jgi:hypothetical protein